jgi:RHS repeat-associated protein
MTALFALWRSLFTPERGFASRSDGRFPENGVARERTSDTYDACPFRWQSKYYEPESGQYYFGYRYYDPPRGRWLSRDPLGLAPELATGKDDFFIGNDGQPYVKYWEWSGGIFGKVVECLDITWEPPLRMVFERIITLREYGNETNWSAFLSGELTRSV